MRSISYIFPFIFLLFACKKQENDSILNEDIKLKNGLLVLNEGLYSLNNSTLSWISFDKQIVHSDLFLQKTNRSLGDTGNDLLKYGSKIYIVMNVSSTIEVLDANSGSFIHQLSMMTSNRSKQPRKIVGYGGNVFVSCFDGFVDVIDTINFTIVKRIKVGDNPDAIQCVRDKIYVSNSGGLNFPNYDSTLSVLNPLTLTETKKIVVGPNPGKIVSRQDGKSIYVIVRGDYGSRPSRLKGVDVSSDEIYFNSSFEVQDIAQFKNNLLLFQSNTTKIQLFDTELNILSQKAVVSNLSIQTFYGMTFLKKRNEVCVFDANSYTNSGSIHMYSIDGIYKSKFNVGLNPSSLIEFE
ncbi:MAG: hypothetical protein EB100_00305 [Crocinitomicaceae bacterium]|nr:hypothetical protein [Crocinitomicaceae bacterium]